jgi:hypothetical protein
VGAFVDITGGGRGPPGGTGRIGRGAPGCAGNGGAPPKGAGRSFIGKSLTAYTDLSVDKFDSTVAVSVTYSRCL